MTVWDDIADALRGEVRKGGRMRYMTVLAASPLRLAGVDDDETIQEGDEDVTLSRAFVDYRTAHAIPKGAVVRVLETGEEFHVMEVSL